MDIIDKDMTATDEASVEIIEEQTESENESADQQESKDDSAAPNDDDDQKLKDGDILSLIRVRFPGNSKSFPFMTGNRTFQYGQKVVAMSDRGMAVGYVNSIPYQKCFQKSMLPLRSINKSATQQDFEKDIEQVKQEKNAENLCLKYVDEYKLDMVVTHVQIIQFGKKAVFYFNAPNRVDFRNLVKSLVSDLKMRIELRQITVRDRAAAIGAVGACGLQTCCSSFLKSYGHVSIKMAKNQNLALIPSKINGVCGQLKCCIKYEDDVYTHKRKKLPREGVYINTASGDIGKVLNLHLIKEQFDMLTDQGKRRRYYVTEFENANPLPKEWKFPDRFDHIVNEFADVVGLVTENEEEDYEMETSLFAKSPTELAKELEERKNELKAEAAVKTSENKIEVKAEEQKPLEENSNESSQSKNKRNRYNRKNNKTKK